MLVVGKADVWILWTTCPKHLRVLVLADLYPVFPFALILDLGKQLFIFFVNFSTHFHGYPGTFTVDTDT